MADVPSETTAPTAAEGDDGRLHVLVVDDDALERELYGYYLSEAQQQEDGDETRFRVSEATDGADFLARLEAGLDDCDCIVLDYSLPDTDGLELLERVREEVGDAVPVVFMTGVGSERIATDALKAGAVDYLGKEEASADALRRAVGGAVDRARLKLEVEEKARRIGEQNAELQRQRDEIRRFYRNVSHELLTPLTSMREFASIVLDGLAGPIGDEQREHIGSIHRSCTELAAGVSMLIDLSRLENEPEALERTPFEIGETIDRVVAELGDEARERGIEIAREIPPGTPLALADPERCAQVLANLLRNALGFTDPGGSVRVVARRSVRRPERLSIAVIDSGRGIEDHDLERIFESLYQSEPPVARGPDETSTTGFGLGLTIARRLVQMQGGRLEVASEVGVGSTFTFSLPAHADGD